MDILINKNLRAQSDKVFVIDFRSHELKTKSEISQPTSVTYLNVRVGEQGRQIKVEGLYISLDSRCSDSLVQCECFKHLQHKFKKNKTAYGVIGGDLVQLKKLK